MTVLKKLFLLTCAALSCGACNDDSETIRFARENIRVENGRLTGSNMHFRGTATVVSADGGTYVNKNAEFEFAGLDDFTLYMHRTRFAAAMPAFEMRIYAQPYTPGTGSSLSFELPSVDPQIAKPNQVGGGFSWTTLPSYELTDLAGTIDDVLCRVGFSCDVPNLGLHRVEFEGRLLEP